MNFDEAVDKLVEQGAIRMWRVSGGWYIAYRMRDGQYEARGINEVEGQWKLQDRMVGKGYLREDGWYTVDAIHPGAAPLKGEAAEKNPGYSVSLQKGCTICEENASSGMGIEVEMRLFRYNPEAGRTKPSYDRYTVVVEPRDRVLDVLEHVKSYHDGTLSFRRSCAHGICGSDAMRVNGANKLACKVLVKDLGQKITVEPLLGLRVIKDFIVDMEPFMESYRSIMPYLVNEEVPADGKERLQSPVDRERFDDTTKCILCAACTTSCPSFWSNDAYVGPATIVNAHRFVFDTRDTAAAKRLEVLNQRMGVWACRTAFNCTEACPREIPVTQLIGEVKRALATGKLD